MATKKTTIAVYGSLRPGMYNSNGLTYKDLGEHKLNYYKMYDLGNYPGIVESPSYMDCITINVLEIDAEDCVAIDMMELQAGYFIKPIYIDGYYCKLYVFNEKYLNDTKIQVGTGNWVTYYHAKNSVNKITK